MVKWTIEIKKDKPGWWRPRVELIVYLEESVLGLVKELNIAPKIRVTDNKQLTDLANLPLGYSCGAMLCAECRKHHPVLFYNSESCWSTEIQCPFITWDIRKKEIFRFYVDIDDDYLKVAEFLKKYYCEYFTEEVYKRIDEAQKQPFVELRITSDDFPNFQKETKIRKIRLEAGEMRSEI